MPEWINNTINEVGSISSIVGLVVTIFLYFEARSIRNSFLRRARLPEINGELRKATSDLSNKLKSWDKDSRPALEVLSNIKALWENIESKLPQEEKKKVSLYLSSMQPKKCLFLSSSISAIQEDAAWELYTELSGLVTTLEQFDKDSKWD